MNPIKQATMVVGSACVALSIIAFHVPSAQAETVTCNINYGEMIYPSGEKTAAPYGTVMIDLERRLASLCLSNGCKGPYPVSITSTRTGFEFYNEGDGSVLYGIVRGSEYGQAGRTKEGVVIMSSGVCY